MFMQQWCSRWNFQKSYRRW